MIGSEGCCGGFRLIQLDGTRLRLGVGIFQRDTSGAFTPDSRSYLLERENGEVDRLTTESLGRTSTVVAPPSSGVEAVIGESADGSILATDGPGNAIGLWDLNARQLLTTVPFQDFAGDPDDAVNDFDFQPAAWERDACTIANRNLTHDQSGRRPTRRPVPQDLPVAALTGWTRRVRRPRRSSSPRPLDSTSTSHSTTSGPATPHCTYRDLPSQHRQDRQILRTRDRHRTRRRRHCLPRVIALAKNHPRPASRVTHRRRRSAALTRSSSRCGSSGVTSQRRVGARTNLRHKGGSHSGEAGRGRGLRQSAGRVFSP